MVKFLQDASCPNLARVVRFDIPNVANDARKFKIFKRYAELDDLNARLALLPGFGPKMVVKEIGLRWGRYPGADDEFFFSAVIAEQYERLIGSWHNAQSIKGSEAAEHGRWMRLVTHAKRIVEATILHELVHWGDVKDGVTNKLEAQRRGWDDWGHAFVHAAYGKKFGYVKDHQTRMAFIDMEIEGWIGWDDAKSPHDPWKYLEAGGEVIRPPR